MKTRSSRLALLAATSLTTLGLAATVAPATASADTGGTTTSKVVSHSASSSSHTSSHATSINGVSLTSTSKVFEYIQSHGATKAQLRHAKVYTLKHSKKLWTSYYNIYHHEVWHWKWYAKGHKFYHERDGYWHDRPCNNKVVGLPKPGKKKIGHKVYGHIKIVKTFSWKVKSTTKVTSKATVTVSVMCKTGYTSASATASSTAYADAAATAYGYGSTVTKATASARGSSVKLSESLYSSTKAQALTAATSSATASASAKVSCQELPPPPPPPTPTPEKPTVTINPINDVGVGETTRVCATANVPGTDSGTLTFTPHFGSVSTASFPVSGQEEECAVYTAPTEVPKGDNEVVPGKDMVSVIVRDTKTGALSKVASTTFDIKNTQPPA